MKKFRLFFFLMICFLSISTTQATLADTEALREAGLNYRIRTKIAQVTGEKLPFKAFEAFIDLTSKKQHLPHEACPSWIKKNSLEVTTQLEFAFEGARILLMGEKDYEELHIRRYDLAQESLKPNRDPNLILGLKSRISTLEEKLKQATNLILMFPEVYGLDILMAENEYWARMSEVGAVLPNALAKSFYQGLPPEMKGEKGLKTQEQLEAFFRMNLDSRGFLEVYDSFEAPADGKLRLPSDKGDILEANWEDIACPSEQRQRAILQAQNLEALNIKPFSGEQFFLLGLFFGELAPHLEKMFDQVEANLKKKFFAPLFRGGKTGFETVYVTLAKPYESNILYPSDKDYKRLDVNMGLLSLDLNRMLQFQTRNWDALIRYLNLKREALVDPKNKKILESNQRLGINDPFAFPEG